MKQKIIWILIAFSFINGFYAQSDNCATATVVNLDASGNACVNGTTINATSANTFYGTCNPSPDVNNEVWYTYVTNGAVNVFDITSMGMSNPEIVIYTVGCSGTLQTCNTATGTGVLTTNIGMPVGTQVWIGIMSNQGTEGGFQFCISSTAPDPSGGNSCGGAIPLCDKLSNFTVDMTTITPSGDWPDCFGAAMNSDVWFTFTATQTGTLEFEVVPTGAGAGGVELDWALYDMTALGGCPSLPSNSAADPSMSCNYNYDGGTGAPAGMTNPAGGEYNAPVNLVAGNTYGLVIDYYTGGGTGTMDFQFLPGMTAEIAPNVDFTVSPSVVCGASMNVTITDNSFGGTPTWNFGDGSPNFVGTNPPAHNYTTPGTYVISATIAGVCNSIHTEFVQLFGPVVTTADTVTETCLGDCDGSISLSTTGGSGIYSYSWAPGGQITPAISNQCAGNYSVTITDATCGNIVQNVTLASGPNCSLPCSITGITVATTACDASGEYTTSGQITFTNPPASGNLVIEDCNGIQQTFPVGGLVSPRSYLLTNQTADGAACDITAYFSADAACTQTLAYTAPSCNCNIDVFQAQQGFCDGVTNTFDLTGSIEFSFPPAAGTLTITADNGTTTYDTIINAPFTSPQTWSISGIPADGSNITITATFSSDAACTATLNTVAPPDCSCPANIGTFTTIINGDGQNNYQLCFGDVLEITSNNNYTYPNEATAPPVPAPFGYNPGLGYLLYSCPPTIGTVPSSDTSQVITNDPCFLGVVAFGDDYDVINNLGAVGAPFTNSTVYFVPITFYDTLNGLYSYTNTNMTCFSMGSPFAVQYLPQVVSSNPTEDCVNGTFTITINGGLPELNGSNFTASNLLPATASFVNTTTTNGGTIQINGLQNGDNYSFDITDANGCPITITGGPFVGLPTANAGANDTSCTLSYSLNATPSIGTGAWTGPANVNFAPINSATATATSTLAGTFDLYWTESNGVGCSTTDTVSITFLNPITTLVVEDCQDSSITVTLSNGLPEQDGSNYTVSNLLPVTATFTTSTATHGADVIAQGLQDGDMYSFDISDNFGCTTSIAGGPFVGLPTANAGQNDTSCTLSYNLNATPSIGTGTWTGPANISFAPNATTPNATATSTLAGPFTLTWTETNTPGCTDAQSIDITFTQMSIPNVLIHLSCNASNDGQVVVAPQGGITPYQYSWSTSSNTTPVENNLSAGNVTISVTDAIGCTLDSTFTLTEPAAFGLTITSTTPVTCNGGNDGQATANVADIIDTYTYSWNTTPVQNTATATNLTLGTYTVIATQVSSGCTDTTTVTITEPTVVTIATISPNITICSGQSTTITATATGGSGAGYVYTWDNGLGTGQNQTVTPGANTTTTYQVTAVDSNNCPSDSATVTVTVHPILSVTASADQPICPNTNTTISATPTGGDGGPYIYSWTPTTNMTGANTQNPTVTPAVTTTYTITLSDGCSPTVTDQVTISLWNLPQPLATASDTDLCIEPRQAITFYNLTDTTNGMVDTTKVFWNFGDGTIVSQPWDTINHTYNQPGTYAVTMTVSSMPSQGGCTVTQTVIPQINIYDLPIADFISTPNITSMFEPEVQFADQSGSTIANWQWDFAGLDSSNSPNPLYIFPDDTNGTYAVTLTVTDNNGCVDDITNTVIITGEYGIYIPNAFTPDFDNKNDWFGPKGFGISSENYHFMIFDRWGEKMFDTNTLYESWDGNYKGTRVQGDTYVWKLSFMDVNMKKHELIGHVTIIQ